MTLEGVVFKLKSRRAGISSILLKASLRNWLKLRKNKRLDKFSILSDGTTHLRITRSLMTSTFSKFLEMANTILN